MVFGAWESGAIMKKPKPHQPHLTKWTVVYSTYVRRFDTLKEAEEDRDKAVERGETAWMSHRWVCICRAKTYSGRIDAPTRRLLRRFGRSLTTRLPL
jgi:hypothetical protein